MSTPQSGIFALGTASHAYLELDAREQGATRELVTAVASLREPRTTWPASPTVFAMHSRATRNPLTGAYYFVPSTESLRRFSGPEEEL